MDINFCLRALAILGETDLETLSYVLDAKLDAQAVLHLSADPAVTKRDQRLLLDPAVAATQLKALEQTDFLHFRLFHERALAYLGQRLQQDDTSIEATWIAIFVRLAERLITQAPQQLFAFLETVRLLPLSSCAEQYRRLFEGIALRHLERYAEALALFDALLTDSTLDLEVRGRTLNARAVGHFWQGRLQPAIDDYQASLAIWQQIDNPVQEGLVQLHLGIAAYELQNYAQAEQYLARAESCFVTAQAFTWLPAVQNERGLVYRDQGRWEEAFACFTRALAQRRAEGANQRVGVILNNVGDLLLLQGKLAEAQAAFAEALEKMTVDSVRINTLINLGLLYLLLDRWADGQSCFVQALTIARKIDRRDIWPAIHYHLGDLLQRQGEIDAALPHIYTGIELIEATRSPLRDEGMKISLLGRWQQLYELAVLLHCRAGAADTAFNFGERARARSFLDMLAQSEIATEPFVESPLTASALQACLPADTAVIEFFATGLPGLNETLLARLPPESQALRHHLLPPEQLLAFVVTQATIQVVVLATTVRQLQAQHFSRTDGRLRGTTPLPGQPLPSAARWRDLGTHLLRPLQPYLLGKSHLFMIPHSTLHDLPLHALLAPDALTGVDGTTVSYAPSASILFKQKRPATSTKQRPFSCLTIGVNANGLTHAEAEAAWIASRLQGATLLGAAATPAAVLAALADYRVIHFSCHGLFRQRTPMTSALLLRDGEVTAADLLQCVRLQADLVTLSACDTGLNQVTPGDELMGLTRAFLGCGARSLLLTLWPVHEIPTRLFMEHFYQTWRQGATKAAAVVAAQRYVADLTLPMLQEHLADYALAPAAVTSTLALFQRMLPSAQPFAHPYYWAPFVLIGDPL